MKKKTIEDIIKEHSQVAFVERRLLYISESRDDLSYGDVVKTYLSYYAELDEKHPVRRESKAVNLTLKHYAIE